MTEVLAMRSQLEKTKYSKVEHKQGRVRFYQIAGFSHYIAAVVIFICLLNVSMAQFQTDQTRQILILNSYHKGFKWTDDEVAGAEEALTKEIKNLELYVEYMDTKRIRSDEYIQLVRRTLQLKYDYKVKLDAIIATDDNALRFLLKYHREPFGEVPVVFCGVNDFEDFMLEGQENFTGLTEALEIKPTIDIALKLHPGTKRIVVISDGTPTGLGQRKTIMAVARQYEGLEFEYLNGEELTTAELLQKLRGLPPESIAFLATWMWDKRGSYVLSGDISSLSLVPSSSVVPVYGFTDMWLDSGIVGGKILNGRSHGYDAAELVLRILNGEKPADIPVHAKSDNPYVFDYNQLKRWQISMFDLPKGSIIINEPETFYYLYKTQIWAVVAIIAGLTVIVIILSANTLHRKRVEEALVHSESIYRKAIENAHGVPYELRYSDGKYVFIGSGIEELFGIPAEEMTLENTLETAKEITVLDPGGYENFEECYQAFRQGKIDHLQLDIRITIPNGEVKWLSNSVLPVQDRKTGEVTGSIGIMQDITERKQIEEALSHSESIYRGAIENTQGVPYQVRFSDGKYVFMGSGAEELLGISPEKLTRENFCEMVEDVIIADMAGHKGLEAYRKAFKEGEIGRYQADLHYRTPKGQMKWFSDCSVPIRDEKTGEVTGALGILQDITERKRIEEALRESEEKFRTIFNNATDGILLVAEKTKKFFIGNKMICQMLGYSREEIENLHILDIHPGKDLPYVTEQFNQQMKGKFTLAKSIPVKRKDGSIFYADVNSAPVVLGGKRYLLGIFRDITERKKTEEQIQEYHTQLKSLASELLLAEERERRHIATELHDRISQSLVISKIKLDSLRESVSSKDTANVLEEVCKTLGQTIQDTRSLTFDLSSPILYELGFEMAVSEWLTEQIQQKNGIATKFRDDGKPKPLDEDIRVLLFRTVRELLINVVKHAKAQNVAVSTRKVNGVIEVRVEDDGIGFSPPKVAPIPDRIGGFGLFSIRERLEHLGGRIKIDSKMGQGCRITVTAPLKR